MPGLSRRTFLTRGSVAVAAGSAVAAIPGLGSVLQSTPAQAAENNERLTDAEAHAASSNGPWVAQVSDVGSGEIHLYHGEKQIVAKNHRLVAQMVRTAHNNEGK